MVTLRAGFTHTPFRSAPDHGYRRTAQRLSTELPSEKAAVPQPAIARIPRLESNLQEVLTNRAHEPVDRSDKWTARVDTAIAGGGAVGEAVADDANRG